MREKAVAFGKASGLIGVLTEPASSLSVKDAPAVILLNSGLLHRVGAHRFHVKLARALASHGVSSFRFDFSGLGDSEGRKDPLPFEQSGPLEVREAIDYVGGKTGAKEFVLAGLCSGADAAFFTALDDARVVGIAQLDGFAYRTWQYYPRRFGPKLLSPKSIKGFIAENVGTRIARLGKSESGGPDREDLVVSPYVRVFPPRDSVADGLRTLVNRGVRLFNFFSHEHYGYRTQYRHCFRTVDFKAQLRLEFLPKADHTLSDIVHQQFVIAGICDWFRKSWIEGDAQPGAARSAGPVPAAVSA